MTQAARSVVRRGWRRVDGCYARRVTTFSLRSLRLRSGEEHRDEHDVALSPLELGGQRYLPVPDTLTAELVVARTTNGTVFELHSGARVHGPCMRCLDDAVLEVPIDVREYQAADPADDDELKRPYVEDDRLDLSAWARDVIALALPDKILCRPACAGLCPTCGKNLNREPHSHAEAQTDSRWAALADLRDRL